MSRRGSICLRLVGLGFLAPALSGCLAAAATGAVVGAAGTVVGVGVKATGAVIGAAIPDGDRRK